mgnify:CR=1 FL=1
MVIAVKINDLFFPFVIEISKNRFRVANARK